MKARRRYLIAGLAAASLVAAAGTFAWQTVRPAKALVGKVPAHGTSRTIELIPSEVYEVTPRGLSEKMRFTGTTQPIEQTVVKARVGGHLAEVLVREGDSVVKDQVIARFDVAELQAKVDERQSALDAARAEARLAARDLVDKETLAGRNIISRAALDAARALSETRAAMVEVSQAQLDVVRKNLVDSVVRAPFDGVVGERIANQGESLPINGRIVTLLDTRRVEVVAQMAAADVMLLEVGQPAVLYLEGFGDRKFAGRITRISPSTRPGSRSIPVYVALTDNRETLRGGLFATGTVVVQEVDRAIAVPKAAIRSDGQGDHVLALDKGVLVRKPVVVMRGWSRGELVEVGGLESGITIVAAPLKGLAPGQAVKVLELR